MIPKINCKDITILIPVRIDSQEREANIKAVLEFIKKCFETEILVLEADKKEKIFSPFIDQKVFIEDHDRIFHRTKYLNYMTQLSKTPYLAIWDTDVLLHPEQLNGAVALLRENRADMVFPYNGKMLDIPNIIRELYLKTQNFEVLDQNCGKFHTMHGDASVGGLFLVNKMAYRDAGMENEFFYGWGPEDAERVKRWEILGYKIERIEGPLFHLCHPRNENSWFGSKEIEIKNRKELINICKKNTNELRHYIQIINNS